MAEILQTHLAGLRGSIYLRQKQWSAPSARMHTEHQSVGHEEEVFLPQRRPLHLLTWTLQSPSTRTRAGMCIKTLLIGAPEP